jgi:uncharacterized membrane protein
MATDAATILTILGMAAVTYATRAGGVLLMGRVPVSPRAERWLKQIPAAVITALITPEIINGGIPALVAGSITAVVAVRTKSVLAAMVTGVITTFIVRRLP